jgi:tetratricopeptide (TPR) repeat protein
VEYPLVRNWRDCSTRRGVWRSPSRSGSSPISDNRRRIVCCITAFYLLVTGLVPRPAAAQSADPDELYKHRDDLASAKQATEIWASRAASGKDFEATWKLARACYWLGTHLPDAERRVQLDRGVKAGEQATQMDAAKPEGHFWLAANMGTLAESYGLIQGLKYRGRIKDELERVLAINPSWMQGSADRALGWWYFRVPGLFGGSDAKSIDHLKKALAYNPQSTITLYFLSEVMLSEGKKDDARKYLQQVLDAPLDPDWTPEDKDYKRKATDKLKELNGGK